MSQSVTFYCSCSACTQIRNEPSTHYRAFRSFRLLFTCFCCSSNRPLTIEDQRAFSALNETKTSTITFRDTDITNKHCSKHDVMIKATRPHFSWSKSEEVRQRVKEANQRWRRMSILPAHLIDFILRNKDFIPFCTDCYENLSPLTFDLCHACITTAIDYQQQTSTSQLVTDDDDDDDDESKTLHTRSYTESICDDTNSFSTTCTPHQANGSYSFAMS